MLVASPMRTVRSLALGATMTAVLAVAPLATAFVAVPSAAIAASATASFLKRKLLHTLNVDARDVLADQLDDRLDELAVIGRAQCKSTALAPGTSRAADAVDVVLRMDR